MNNLVVRSLTGLVFISAIIGSILWNEWAVTLIFGGFMLLGIHEFTGLVNKHTPYSVQRWFTITVAALIFVAFAADFSGHFETEGLFLLLPVLLISLVSSLFRQSTTPLQNAAIGFFSWIYILVPFIMIVHIAFAENNPWELIGMFVLIWTNDTMAYATGRLFGRTKLFERISPKKTWEGTIGGILFALLAGFLWSVYLSELPLWFWLIVSPLVAAAAIFGDLFESQLKRQLGVKDSGTILPGHGGILDRFDAALLAVPVFYAFWAIATMR
jgi:phosphatidate cytidylyltransferase